MTPERNLSGMTSNATHTSLQPSVVSDTLSRTIQNYAHVLHAMLNFQMDLTRDAIRDHELKKYLELLVPGSVDGLSHHTNVTPFSFRLPEPSVLHDTLVTYIELVQSRLAVQGAFVVLTDGATPYFLVGTSKSQYKDAEDSHDGAARWLGSADVDLQQWLWIFKQTLSVNVSPAFTEEAVFHIPSLDENEHTSKLSSVRCAPYLASYAGTPIISTQGVSIGVLFVVDNYPQDNVPEKNGEFLTLMASKCMGQLESARQTVIHARWKRLNEQLCHFVGSRATRDQQLEEPASLGGKYQQQRKENQMQNMQSLALRHGYDRSAAKEVSLLGNDTSLGGGNNQATLVENDTGQSTADEDERHHAQPTVTEPTKGSRHSDHQGKTAYQEIFTRAAGCLQEALQVDGVLFANGLVGHHGVVQPTAELDEELEREMAQEPRRYRISETGTGPGSASHEEEPPPPHSPLHEREGDRGLQVVPTRTYTSPEYLKWIYAQRPAEILGMCTRGHSWCPKRKSLNKTTLGLAELDEDELQLLMDNYPNGSVWYVCDSTGICYSLREDHLVEDESLEVTRHLISTFPGVRQMIFHPLTDPASLKRLAGCFVWTTRTSPMFTDSTDLPSLRGFLHVLESEISRLDVSAAVKQQEAFVSSVSHELRTPLHGILGSASLLADADLGPFHAELVDTISSCGETLEETLKSVLSYARINHFERQQQKDPPRRPAHPDWGLPNKQHISPGPETNCKGLYVCTNIALLCEEIAEVLEAGKLYKSTIARPDVDFVVAIDYEENWDYFTEPGALRRIVLNVVGNALKFTTTGLVSLRLAASHPGPDQSKATDDQDSPSMITITVLDTGKGMSKDFLENTLFVPFTQGDASLSHGVGLGMSIVKGLVSLLSGEIKVESEECEGTKVTVTFPMQICNSGKCAPDESTNTLQRCAASLREEHLSVILFGFPNTLRLALEKDLCDWFRCDILEATEGAKPDVILVEEGNGDVTSEVERYAQHFGTCCVLLSIALSPDARRVPIRYIKGYRKWDRMSRPVGPNALGKALQACVSKLRNPYEYESGSEDGERYFGHETHDRDGSQPPDSDRGVRAKSTGSSNEDSQACGFSKSSKLSELPGRSASSSVGPPAELPSLDLRVLVVEDNAVNRRLLGAFLKKCGCQHVRYAENGVLAVDLVQEPSQGFDVIFMDLSMPVMDGFQATREIRRIEGQQRVAIAPNSRPPAYIVALTGLANDREQEEAFTAGVDEFVTKPVKFQKLSSLLRDRAEKLVQGRDVLTSEK